MIDVVEKLILLKDRNGDRAERDWLSEACNEIDRLRRWKAEALVVMDEVDALHATLDNPTLGATKVANIAAELERLRGEVERWRYWAAVSIEALRDAATDLEARLPDG